MNAISNLSGIVPGGPWIQTASGMAFPYENPGPEHVTITDIALSLSRIPRFLGHTRLPVNVAAHSVTVMHRVAETLPEAALAALLHDAHEAYIGDLPHPLKSLPAVRAAITPIEERIQAAIHERFGVPHPIPESWRAAIKAADLWALAVESAEERLKAPVGWAVPDVEIPEDYATLDEDEAWHAFIEAFEALTGEEVA